MSGDPAISFKSNAFVQPRIQAQHDHLTFAETPDDAQLCSTSLADVERRVLMTLAITPPERIRSLSSAIRR